MHWLEQGPLCSLEMRKSVSLGVTEKLNFDLICDTQRHLMGPVWGKCNKGKILATLSTHRQQKCCGRRQRTQCILVSDKYEHKRKKRRQELFKIIIMETKCNALSDSQLASSPSLRDRAQFQRGRNGSCPHLSLH